MEDLIARLYNVCSFVIELAGNALEKLFLVLFLLLLTYFVKLCTCSFQRLPIFICECSLICRSLTVITPPEAVFVSIKYNFESQLFW